MCLVSTISCHSVLCTLWRVLCPLLPVIQCSPHLGVLCPLFPVIQCWPYLDVSCLVCFLSPGTVHTLMCLVSTVSCHPVLSTLWCVLCPLFPVTRYCPRLLSLVSTGCCRRQTLSKHAVSHPLPDRHKDCTHPVISLFLPDTHSLFTYCVIPHLKQTLWYPSSCQTHIVCSHTVISLILHR